MNGAPLVVEVFSFRGCPNHKAAQSLVNQVARDLGLDVRVEVPTLEEAERLGVLGSPTVRVDGQDVEPGADRRSDFTLSCRVYQTEAGFRGTPAVDWIRNGLTRAAGLNPPAGGATQNP